MKNYFSGKTILVTGGSGSIGSEMVRHLIKYNPKTIRVFSNDEDGQFNFHQEIISYENIRYLLGDVRDKDRLRKAVDNVDIVFHAAAFKHVAYCEYNPFETVKTNVLGTQNLIDVSLDANVEKFITISTDKATNPINVLGATKLLAERLTVSADYYKGYKKTVLSCVRFGNVLGSRGSVVPIFKELIKKGIPVTVTNPEMTRFVMSISRTVDLVLKAAVQSIGGELFILKMPALRIGDLAKAMIEVYAPKYGHKPEDIKIKVIGMRKGEKYHEELMTEYEAENSYETEDMFVLVPQKIFEGTKEYKKTINAYSKCRKTQTKIYQSNNTKLMSVSQIKKMLIDLNI